MSVADHPSVRDLTIVHDDVPLHVRDVGPVEAPPVVFLHGIMGHAREWDPVVEALAASHRVLVVDQRGHGESGYADDYALDPMVADVLAVLHELGIERAALVGHSMGGMVALALAGRRPDVVRRLALIDVVPDSVTPEAAAEFAPWIQALGGRTFASVDDAVAHWMTGDPFAAEQHMRRYLEHCLVATPDRGLRHRFDADRIWRFVTDGVSADELWRAADRVAAPTLLVRGAESPFTPAPAVAEFVRRTGAEVATIDRAAHDLGVQRPEAVADALVGFLVEE